MDTNKNLDPRQFLNMRNPIILDSRNGFSLEQMDSMNVVYDSAGRRVAGKLV
jgi:hypothetical protein